VSLPLHWAATRLVSHRRSLPLSSQLEEVLRRCHIASFTDLWAHATAADDTSDPYGVQVYVEALEMARLVQGNFVLTSDVACDVHWTVLAADQAHAKEERARRRKRVADLRTAGAKTEEIDAAVAAVSTPGAASAHATRSLAGLRAALPH